MDYNLEDENLNNVIVNEEEEEEEDDVVIKKLQLIMDTNFKFQNKIKNLHVI